MNRTDFEHFSTEDARGGEQTEREGMVREVAKKRVVYMLPGMERTLYVET